MKKELVLISKNYKNNNNKSNLLKTNTSKFNLFNINNENNYYSQKNFFINDKSTLNNDNDYKNIKVGNKSYYIKNNLYSKKKNNLKFKNYSEVNMKYLNNNSKIIIENKANNHYLELLKNNLLDFNDKLLINKKNFIKIIDYKFFINLNDKYHDLINKNWNKYSNEFTNNLINSIITILKNFKYLMISFINKKDKIKNNKKKMIDFKEHLSNNYNIEKLKLNNIIYKIQNINKNTNKIDYKEIIKEKDNKIDELLINIKNLKEELNKKEYINIKLEKNIYELTNKFENNYNKLKYKYDKIKNEYNHLNKNNISIIKEKNDLKYYKKNNEELKENINYYKKLIIECNKRIMKLENDYNLIKTSKINLINKTNQFEKIINSFKIFKKNKEFIDDSVKNKDLMNIKADDKLMKESFNIIQPKFYSILDFNLKKYNKKLKKDIKEDSNFLINNLFYLRNFYNSYYNHIIKQIYQENKITYINEFLYSYLSNFYYNHELKLIKYKDDLFDELENINNFLNFIYDKRYNSLFEVHVLKKMIENYYFIDEIFYYLSCRNLFQRKSFDLNEINDINNYDILEYIEFDLLEDIFKIYLNKWINTSKLIQKLKEKKILKYNKYLININFVLNLLLEIYKEKKLLNYNQINLRLKKLLDNRNYYQINYDNNNDENIITFSIIKKLIKYFFKKINDTEVYKIFSNAFTLSKGFINFNSIIISLNDSNLFIYNIYELTNPLFVEKDIKNKINKIEFNFKDNEKEFNLFLSIFENSGNEKFIKYINYIKSNLINNKEDEKINNNFINKSSFRINDKITFLNLMVSDIIIEELIKLNKISSNNNKLYDFFKLLFKDYLNKINSNFVKLIFMIQKVKNNNLLKVQKLFKNKN